MLLLHSSLFGLNLRLRLCIAAQLARFERVDYQVPPSLIQRILHRRIFSRGTDKWSCLFSQRISRCCDPYGWLGGWLSHIHRDMLPTALSQSYCLLYSRGFSSRAFLDTGYGRNSAGKARPIYSTKNGLFSLLVCSVDVFRLAVRTAHSILIFVTEINTVF